MAYLLVLHLFAVIAVVDPAAVERVKKFVFRSPDSLGEYRGMVAAHAQAMRSMPGGTILFMGDSRLRGLDVTTIVEQPVMNMSIGGDTTAGLLYRLPRYDRLNHCGLVVLSVGVNDLSHFSDDVLLRNYDHVLDLLRNTGVRKVAVCSILPVDSTTFQQANAAWLRGHRTTNQRIAAVNERLRDLCARRPDTTFLDTVADMSDSTGNLRSEYSFDGLHLTASGNQAWAQALRRRITSVARTE